MPESARVVLPLKVAFSMLLDLSKQAAYVAEREAQCRSVLVLKGTL